MIDPELSIVIPAYNEEQRLGRTLDAVRDFLAQASLRYEVIVVDDGSSDGTAALVGEFARRAPEFRCVSYAPNRGKGHAVRIGMLAARGAVRLMCDADGSCPPHELPKLVNRVMLGEVDIAIGSRYSDGAACDVEQPFYRRWWSRLANAVVRRTLVRDVVDTQCGFKAFSAAAAHGIFTRTTIDGWAFDLEALALAQRLGYTVREVPIVWSDDPRSRIHPVRDAIGVVREWIAIRRNLSRGIYGELEPAASR